MKPFKTIDEQYTLLVSRGLSFSNEVNAKQYLLSNNYYNVINCYAKFFMNQQDQFLPGTNFNEIIYVHYFDKELKNILFNYIIEAEKHLKSIISYHFSKEYQMIDYAYLFATSYNSDNILEVTTLISELSTIIKWQLKDKNNNSIKHYFHKHQVIPLWILVNYMNLGQIIKFYKHLKMPLQNKIAKDFSFFLNENLNTKNTKLTVTQLISYLKNVLELRNIVAHNNKILGFKCKNNTIYLKELHNHYILNPNTPRQDVFNVFIIMQCLLSKKQFTQLNNKIHKRINILNQHLYTIPISTILDSIGFTMEWYNNY